MRDLFRYLGLQASERRTAQREWARRLRDASIDEAMSTVEATKQLR